MDWGARLLLSTIAVGGCVDSFRGSNVQIDLSPTTPAQAAFGQMPTGNQLPQNVHWRLYGISGDGEATRLFELQRFEVHTIVDPFSPCFIDTGANVPHPGLHVTRFAERIAEDTGIPDYTMPPAGSTEQQQIDAATAAQRAMNVVSLAGSMGIKVVTSASEGSYPVADADCTSGGIPAPSCIDDESNARRLELCEAVWRADPDLYEGTDRILTAPINGTTNGFVVGLNPVNLAPVGGAQFFVDEALDDIDEYALYVYEDGAETGTFMIAGRPVRGTRGVQQVHLESPFVNFSADLAIFANLGEDDVRF